MKKNVFFLSAFILTLVGALFLSARIISADEDTPSFITKTIAQKFHLKESKVKEIIYFYHREKRKAHLSHMLDILIEKGKITSEQKEDLLNKLSQKDNLPFHKRQAIIKEWLKQNNIDPFTIFSLRRFHKEHIIGYYNKDKKKLSYRSQNSP